MEDASNGEQILLLNLAWGLHRQHRRAGGAPAPIGRLLIHHYELKALGQALRNNLLAHLLGGKGLPVDSPALGIIAIDIVRQEGVVRDHVVVVERSLVREVVRGDGQAGGDGQ